MSASQGRYSPAQLLLDISQGARVATSAYSSAEPPPLSLRAEGTGGVIEGWSGVLARARAAPQELEPGLLAGQAGGGAYAGTAGLPATSAVLAAGRSGRVDSVSTGTAATIVGRTLGLLARRALVVADMPRGASGLAALRRLVRARPPGSLLIAVERAGGSGGGQLLWTASAGLGPGGRELTSASTQQRGLVVSVDLAPTILGWLGRPLPASIRGRRLESDGRLDASALAALMARLRVIGPRRLPALGFLLLGWLVLALCCLASPPARAWALRVGGLAVLWAPVAVMITAAFEPGAGAEYLAIVLICLGLGALTDRLAAWPRGLIAPAVAAPLAITVDALLHGQLLMRSLLGPDPILGARFYGIGNELKPALAVAALAGVAAALHPGRRERRARVALTATGVVLAVIEGAARIGAAVGGVILVCAGFAVALIVLAPGPLTRRRAMGVLVAPAAGLVLLALIDLLSAHGSGHFTGSVLHARSAGDLREIIVRRYRSAWIELGSGAMPFVSALAVGAGVLGVLGRERLLAPVGSNPLWEAALAGGLAAGLAGSLVEDSGPVLLVVAVFALGCVLSYLWGRPPASAPHTPGTPRAARSRARRPPAAPVR